MHLDGDQWIRVHLNDYHPDDVTPEAEHEIFSSVQAQWDARDKLAEPERFLLEIPSVPTSAEEMIERDIVDTFLYRKDVYRHMVYLQMSQDHMNMKKALRILWEISQKRSCISWMHWLVEAHWQSVSKFY